MDKNTRQLIIWGVVPILLFALWYGIIYYPNQRAINNYNARKQELLGTMGREITGAEIQMLRIRLDSLDTIYQDKESRLFPQAKLIGLGDFVKGIGQDAGLILQGLTPDYSTIKNFIDPTQSVNQFPIEIEYRGSFAALTRFWDKLDELEYFLKVNEYFIDFAEAGKPDLRIRLNAEMFIKKPGPQAAKATGGKKTAVSL